MDSSASAESIALLDIGSNALRCVVARLDARPGFEIELRQRVQTRLGDSASGLLPSAAIDATLRAARRFLKKVRRKHQGARVLCVATAAVREAENRAALLGPLGELGVQEVRILSGCEEGRLGAEAALRAWPIARGVIVDVGGGSLQVTAVIDGVIQESASAPLGVVRLSQRFIQSDPITPDALGALRAEIRAQLAPLLDALPTDGVLLASGGVVNALGRLTLGRRAAPALALAGPGPVSPTRADVSELAEFSESEPPGDSESPSESEPPGDSESPGEAEPPSEPEPSTHGLRLARAELAQLRAWLEPMPLAARAAAPGLRPERADVIVTGAVVFEELLAASGFDALTVTRTSVREGVLWREAVLWRQAVLERESVLEREGPRRADQELAAGTLSMTGSGVPAQVSR